MTDKKFNADDSYKHLKEQRDILKETQEKIKELEAEIVEHVESEVTTVHGDIKVIRPAGNRTVSVDLLDEDLPRGTKGLITKQSIDLSAVNLLVKNGKLDESIVKKHTTVGNPKKPTVKLT